MTGNSGDGVGAGVEQARCVEGGDSVVKMALESACGLAVLLGRIFLAGVLSLGRLLVGAGGGLARAGASPVLRDPEFGGIPLRLPCPCVSAVVELVLRRLEWRV